MSFTTSNQPLTPHRHLQVESKLEPQEPGDATRGGVYSPSGAGTDRQYDHEDDSEDWDLDGDEDQGQGSSSGGGGDIFRDDIFKQAGRYSDRSFR